MKKKTVGLLGHPDYNEKPASLDEIVQWQFQVVVAN